MGPQSFVRVEHANDNPLLVGSDMIAEEVEFLPAIIFQISLGHGLEEEPYNLS
jgi:hypothetical protein